MLHADISSVFIIVHVYTGYNYFIIIIIAFHYNRIVNELKT